MKKKILLLLALSVFASACCTALTAFAAPGRWFGSTIKDDNTVRTASWIKVTVTGEDCFSSDEEYATEFVVRQWAEGGNYRLILRGVRFFDPSGAESLDPDCMWEYYDGGDWAPVTDARGLELIPAVELKAHTAYLKIRVTPGFFDTAGFAKYLDCNLELTAALIAY